MTTYASLAAAIARSISHTEIVHVAASDLAVGDKCVDVIDLIADLYLYYGHEDDVVNDTVHEIWGTDSDGYDWRVHIYLAA